MRNFTTIEKFYNVYFTSYPYHLYNIANSCGNLAFAGIGLGLIHAQNLFWIANVGTGICIYNIKNEGFIYHNMVLFVSCGFLYRLSFIKVMNFILYI